MSADEKPHVVIEYITFYQIVPTGVYTQRGGVVFRGNYEECEKYVTTMGGQNPDRSKYDYWLKQ